MVDMKGSVKVLLLVAALALVGCFVVLVSRPDEPVVPNIPDSVRGPAFEVQVVKPRSARPLFGLLPSMLEKRMAGDGELRFGSASPGAEVVSAGHNRIELRAEGWDLVVETDAAGHVVAGTRLVFPIELAEKDRTLRCGPANGASGYFRTTAGAGSDTIDGEFVVELATCENVATGKVISWPPAPLTVRGSFRNLPIVQAAPGSALRVRATPSPSC